MPDSVDPNTVMKSSTEPDNLTDFLSTAELKDNDFESQKANTVVIESNAFVQVRHEPTAEQLAEQKEFWNSLRVPRRPRWTRDMEAEELHKLERDSFLEWRRNLSQVEERDNITMTPFEKNLNVWRQLWRVVEMSDVLVQIVDARDPELFRCEDLERYTREVGPNKTCLLLLNKADLLTVNQRKTWARYYESIGVKFRFFSAKQVEAPEPGAEGDEDDEEHSSYEGLDPRDAPGYEEEQDESSEVLHEEPATGGPEDIIGRRALIDQLSQMHTPEKGKERLMVGFCGYPNVGKSSTINKLMGEKKVTVSATPGKTKHFQSLFLEDVLCVLDCPGLVFPNFVTNKATMVCNGLLPIDELRDWRSPGSVVCQRIKRNVLEAQYGIVLPEPDKERYQFDAHRAPTVDELFSAYAFVRGFMGQSGAPNMARAARIILKDYVNGVLRYAAAPPGELGKDFDPTEGQEDAIRKKMDIAKKHVPGEARKPTYVEIKAKPNVVEVTLLPKGALVKGRKAASDKIEGNKKKRGGKGKHRKDIEYPYGLPPDPHDHAKGSQ